LRNSGPKYTLNIPLKDFKTPVRFEFAQIPTQQEDSDYETELRRFCTPLKHATWAPLDGFEAIGIWVLQMNVSSFIHQKQTTPTELPWITLTFPSITTLENRVHLEELAHSRHKCVLLECSEFCICPTTLEEPNASEKHFHCMSQHCVLFFQKVLSNQ
jgi:hypothetical protein